MITDVQRAGVERNKTQSMSSCDNVTPLLNCRKYDGKRHANLVTGVLKVSAGAFPKIEMATHTNQQEVQGAENKSLFTTEVSLTLKQTMHAICQQ